MATAGFQASHGDGHRTLLDNGHPTLVSGTPGFPTSRGAGCLITTAIGSSIPVSDGSGCRVHSAPGHLLSSPGIKVRAGSAGHHNPRFRRSMGAPELWA